MAHIPYLAGSLAGRVVDKGRVGLTVRLAHVKYTITWIIYSPSDYIVPFNGADSDRNSVLVSRTYVSSLLTARVAPSTQVTSPLL